MRCMLKNKRIKQMLVDIQRDQYSGPADCVQWSSGVCILFPASGNFLWPMSYTIGLRANGDIAMLDYK